ncbi:monovalent cation/H(+) antiporter subunit G [Ehrlichia ruminantium]|uniref:monovalent cation/H(+) antiporter subunit G n=1 Tax=Ehrlichia ruminantium TaxID=779 RepID=UPI0009954FDE|nr:monovalent cation/H(+) antiporter subunit G [Ehrlichia ruminantium]
MIGYLSIIILGIGLFLIVTSVIGVMRFPGFYTKLHPAGITDSLGSALILIGVALRCELSMFTVKVLLLICFLWITSTTASYALVRAAYHNKKTGKNDDE